VDDFHTHHHIQGFGMTEEKRGFRTDHSVERFAQGTIQFRWIIPVIAILAGVFIGSGGRFIQFKNDYQYFFSKENPELNNFESNQKIYKKNDNCLFVLAPKSGEVFTR
jgi:uncharacterized protein